MQRNILSDDTVMSLPHIPPRGYRGFSGFHKYWGKKPTEAWRFLIQHLSNENDIILDPFLGSGLIAKECSDLERRFIGFDINPISVELANLYINPPNYLDLKNAFGYITVNFKHFIDALYKLPDGRVATHILWEGDEISRIWTKSGRKRVEIDLDKIEIGTLQFTKSYEPKRIRKIRLFDNSRINSRKSNSLNDLFTSRALQTIDYIKEGIEFFDGDVKRALLLTLTASVGQMSKMVFAVTKRGKARNCKHESNNVEVGSWVIGYWKPEMHFEVNALNCFENKARRLLNAVGSVQPGNERNNTKGLHKLLQGNGKMHIELGDSTSLLESVPSRSVKLVIADPPHGDRVPYLELSELWNTMIGQHPDFEGELVVSNAKDRNKSTEMYNNKLADILLQCSHILEDNGIMAVIFNARSKDHWASINYLGDSTNLEYLGCYDMGYSAGSVVQDSRAGSLKTDYVLLYGKNPVRSFRNSVRLKFSDVPGWSVSKPKGVE